MDKILLVDDESAITDNLAKCNTLVYFAERLLYKWLNRKSQRKAYNWPAFRQARAYIGWPSLKIHKDLFPWRRGEEAR